MTKAEMDRMAKEMGMSPLTFEWPFVRRVRERLSEVEFLAARGASERQPEEGGLRSLRGLRERFAGVAEQGPRGHRERSCARPRRA